MNSVSSLLVLCDTVNRDGGTESYLSRVLPALRERGIALSVLARRVLDPKSFGVPASELRWAADDATSDARAARSVRDVIARLRPDAVMTSNVHDALVMDAARCARRLIVRVHDHRLFCPQGDRQFPNFPQPCTLAMSRSTCLAHAVLRGCVAGPHPKTLHLIRSRAALRDAALRADRFVVSSQFVADLCITNGVTQRQVALLPPPFAGHIERAPRPVRDRVLFAGRLVRDKGLASLVRALALVPRVRRPSLAVAGSMTGEARAIPHLAARLRVDLQMLGKLDTAALEAAIDASTMVAVPSLWPEPFGLMGIEAHARGRPVVAYDVGGIPAWMGEAGILVRRGDEHGLARAIETAATSQDWQRFSDAALRQARAYEVRDHAAALAAVLA